MKKLLIVMITGLLVSTAFAQRYTYFTDKPVNTPEVENAPDYKVGWVVVRYDGSEFGTIKLTGVSGKGVQALVPRLNEPFELLMYKSDLQNQFCLKPPCYVGDAFTVTFHFTPTQPRYSLFNKEYSIFCGVTYHQGTADDPMVHAISVFEDGRKRNLIMTCS